MTHKLIIKDESGSVINTQYGSKEALAEEAKRLSKQYKQMYLRYKVSVVKR